jgi:peptide/nickel transport system substrate-binding protein
VASPEPAYQGFDPQAAYTSQQFELLRCCLVRTLMTYPGLPNYAGTQPVPDLAIGYPTVSSDGMTWTFHLRTGIHYAPPLEAVAITSGDIVRALLRAGSDEVNGGPGAQYLSSIEGFDEYTGGGAERISGVSTPDDHTLQIHLVRPDRTLEHIFAMAFTSPIPPAPGAGDAVFGVATGHAFSSRFDGGPPQADGYGPFLVSSGPYMIEGAADVDFTAPPSSQRPASGFVPGWWFDDPGSITLVRNPSWDGATDPNRPALPDQISVSLAPADDPYPALRDGRVDVVLENPPGDVLAEFTASANLQNRVTKATSNFTRFMTVNVAQPPLDDVHVRRALALALNPESIVPSDTEIPASHLIPDPLIGGLMSSWTGFPEAGTASGRAAAAAEMDLSRYGSDGRCQGSHCRVVIVPGGQVEEAAVAALDPALRAIGLKPVFREADCSDARAHIALCLTGWFTDFPQAGNMIVPFLGSVGGYNASLLGSAPGQLERWGYRTRNVPRIDSDYRRCVTASGVEAAMCWARIDQLLTSEIVALVPISSGTVVRLRSAYVSTFAIDQAFGEAALDRLEVDR